MRATGPPIPADDPYANPSVDPYGRPVGGYGSSSADSTYAVPGPGFDPQAPPRYDPIQGYSDSSSYRNPYEANPYQPSFRRCKPIRCAVHADSDAAPTGGAGSRPGHPRHCLGLGLHRWRTRGDWRNRPRPAGQERDRRGAGTLHRPLPGSRRSYYRHCRRIDHGFGNAIHRARDRCRNFERELLTDPSIRDSGTRSKILAGLFVGYLILWLFTLSFSAVSCCGVHRHRQQWGA